MKSNFKFVVFSNGKVIDELGIARMTVAEATKFEKILTKYHGKSVIAYNIDFEED